jgi:hypothetical protein
MQTAYPVTRNYTVELSVPDRVPVRHRPDFRSGQVTTSFPSHEFTR